MVASKLVSKGVDLPYITSVTPDQKGLAMQINSIVNRVQQELATQAAAINNLPVGNLNAGINASASTFWRGDGTWAAIATQIATPGTTVVGDAVTWGNTTGTSLVDTTWTTITQNSLSLFSSTKQGVVPSSSGFATSNSYLGGDVAWHTLPTVTQNFLYLGTVSVVSTALSDTTIVAANNSTYRSFKFVMKNIVPATSAVNLGLQVHSGGAFQTTNYISAAFQANGSGSNGSSFTNPGTTSYIILAFNTQITNASPGYAGELTVSNLAGTTDKKNWFGTGGYLTATANTALVVMSMGWWAGGNGAIDGFQIISSGAGGLTSGSVDIYGML